MPFQEDIYTYVYFYILITRYFVTSHVHMRYCMNIHRVRRTFSIIVLLKRMTVLQSFAIVFSLLIIFSNPGGNNETIRYLTPRVLTARRKSRTVGTANHLSYRALQRARPCWDLLYLVSRFRRRAFFDERFRNPAARQVCILFIRALRRGRTG
jgi:phosphatidylglycerophosphate synthase